MAEGEQSMHNQRLEVKNMRVVYCRGIQKETGYGELMMENN